MDVNLTGTLNVARAAYPWLRALARLADGVRVELVHARPARTTSRTRPARPRSSTWPRACPRNGPTTGIRVNAVSPERTDTPMRRKAFPGESPEGLLGAEEVAVATLRLLRPT